MRRNHIRVNRRVNRETRKRPFFTFLVTVALMASLVAILIAFTLFRSAYDDTKEEFIGRLKTQRQIVELNNSLKMELFAITQRGYVEFAAQERLGLKRPTEEEVVVLR